MLFRTVDVYCLYCPTPIAHRTACFLVGTTRNNPVLQSMKRVIYFAATATPSFLAALRSLRARALAFLASCCSRRAFFLLYSALSLWINSINTRLFLYTLPLHFR